MAIHLRCECGKKLRAEDDWAGRHIRCPHCGAATVVPETPDDIIPFKDEQQVPADPPAQSTATTRATARAQDQPIATDATAYAAMPLEQILEEPEWKKFLRISRGGGVGALLVFCGVVLAIVAGVSYALAVDRPGLPNRMIAVTPLLAIGLLLALLGCVVMLRTRGRLVRELSQYGPPQQVAAEITREMKDNSRVTNIYGNIFTQSWYLSTTHAAIVRIDDVVWVYQRVHKTNGAVTGHSILVHDRFGKGFGTDATLPDEADKLMSEWERRAPDIYFGYDRKLKKQWNADPASLCDKQDEAEWEWEAPTEHGLPPPHKRN